MASTSTSSCVYTGDHPFKVLLVLPIIEETYDVYGAISSTLASKGKQMGDFDEIIAAIVISHNGTIVTRDHHFDRLPMLNVIHY